MDELSVNISQVVEDLVAVKLKEIDRRLEKINSELERAGQQVDALASFHSKALPVLRRAYVHLSRELPQASVDQELIIAIQELLYS